jgi:monoamine oxidase
MASDGISVAIIGGGIGGLAAALSLLRVGIDVHVYEQARELTEVGADIQISPNASRILHRLGLAVPAALMYCQRPHAHIRYERLRRPRATRVQGLRKATSADFIYPTERPNWSAMRRWPAAQLIGPSTRLTGSMGMMRARSGIVTLIA